MDAYKDTPRPPGPGRAWMLATFTMLLGLGVGIYLTAEKPKPKYSTADLREPPGAGVRGPTKRRRLPRQRRWSRLCRAQLPRPV
jgi:hypothetical protein